MNHCANCGIELESNFRHCPLCHTPFETGPHNEENIKPVYPSQEKPLTARERLHLFWELSGLLHFSAAAVTLLIDIVINKKPEWSLFCLLGIAASYIYITLLVFTIRKTLFFLTGLLVNTLILILAIDWLNNGITWFFIPGIPLVGFFVILLGLVLLFIRSTSQRGFNVIAVCSVAFGLYIMSIELSLELADGIPLSLSWSAIVAAAILPFALFLLYFHYRLKRGTSLRKFFHL